MVFTAPAVHYSALATLPPEPTASTSQQSINYTANVRFKLSRIFKRLLNHDDIQNEHTITNEFELPKPILHLTEATEKANKDDPSIIVKSPNNNNSGHRTSIGQESSKTLSSSIEPLERLPFTEPYFSMPSKTELSTYHKRCIHQQKYINQKQTTLPQPNSSSPSSLKEHWSDLATCRLQNLIEQQRQIKFNHKQSNSTTTLPLSPSIENRIGLRHISRQNSMTNTHGVRSSYTQRLRRLHSRPISTETKTTVLPSISSSIAHRIELLKQAMRNDQIEGQNWKIENKTPIESSSTSPPPILNTINKQTQTGDNQLKSSEIHHIHHHHIHSSSISSLEWRTYLSIIGLISLIFLLLIELTTIVF